jgi:peptidase M28-like protein
MSTKTLPSVAFMLMVTVLPVFAQLRFLVMSREVVEQRLQLSKGNDSPREAGLKAMFESSGWRGSNLAEQTVKGLKQPNLICVLPGSTDSTIVVGAHFDHVDAGDGVVDNWTGASMLPSLINPSKTNRDGTHFCL